MLIYCISDDTPLPESLDLLEELALDYIRNMVYFI